VFKKRCFSFFYGGGGRFSGSRTRISQKEGECPPESAWIIPGLGINWVMAIPALCCAIAVLPMALANRAQPEAQTDHHDG